MAEFEAVDLAGLSGPDSAPAPESTNPSFFALSLDPGKRSSRRSLELLVFAGSLAVHIGLYLRIHNNITPQVTRFVRSQVDIELAPPVPTEEPKIKEPDPVPAPPAEKPVPRTETHAPVAQTAPVALPDNSNLPSSEEGLLPPTPPGTGTPGPAPVVAPPPPPPPPPPAPVVQAREGANYKHNPRPAYPKIALREEWEGTVVLRARISATGRVESVTVQKSAGHSVLDDAAVETAKTWVFDPATQGGQPVSGTATFPIAFKLQ